MKKNNDNDDKADFSNSDNRDLTIQFQAKQIEQLTNSVESLIKQNEKLSIELENVKDIAKGIQKAKKKTQKQQLKPQNPPNQKLNWQMVLDICSLVQNGVTYKDACVTLGLSKRTAERYWQKGTNSDNDKDLKRILVVAVEKIITHKEMGYLKYFDDALNSNSVSDKDKVAIAEKRLRYLKPNKYNHTILAYNAKIKEEEILEESLTSSPASRRERLSPAEESVSMDIFKIIRKRSLEMEVVVPNTDPIILAEDDEFIIDNEIDD